MRLKIWQWSLIFIVCLFCLICATLNCAAQKRDAVRYELTFYEIIAAPDTVPIFTAGSTIEIGWEQPLGEMAYELQPNPICGDRIGTSYMLSVPDSAVTIDDTTKQMTYSIELDPGYWEITVLAIDAADNESKECDAVPFLLKAGVPYQAVRLYIKLMGD